MGLDTQGTASEQQVCNLHKATMWFHNNSLRRFVTAKFVAEGKKVLVVAASLQDGRRRDKCGHVNISHLDDLYGVVLLVFFF